MNQSSTIESPRGLSLRKCTVHIPEQPCGIAHAAQQCIESSKYAEVRLIACELRGGRFILRGRVSSFYLKQLAQEIVRSLGGVEDIVNQIEVVYR